MTMRKGLPAKNAATDADDTRYDFRNDVVCNLNGTPRAGVTSPVAVALVTGSATMNVSVAAFSGIASRDGGVVKLANDGATNVLIAAAPGANSRIDVIAARQNDNSSTVSVPDADNVAKLYVIQGTPLASPVKPAVPDGSLELATVVVAAGNTNTNAMTITQTAAYTAAPGAVVPFRTKALLDAWTTPPRLGQLADVIQDTTAGLNGTYRWNGTAWRRVGPPIGGVFKRAADFALTAGVFTAVPFTLADSNDGPLWDAGVNPTRFTAPVAGIYHIAGFNNQINSTGTGDLTVRINGIANNVLYSVANSSGAALLTWGLDVVLTAGDYVEIFARTSGGAFPWIAANRVTVSLLTAM